MIVDGFSFGLGFALAGVLVYVAIGALVGVAIAALEWLNRRRRRRQGDSRIDELEERVDAMSREFLERQVERRLRRRR